MNQVCTLSPTESGKNFAFYHGDNIEVIKGIPDESVGLTVTSPPFAQMYAYSDTPRDIGNTSSESEMLEHFGFLIDELLRVTAAGRSCCVHLTQINAFKHRDGFVGRFDFRGDIIRLFQDHGWIYASEVTIDKDPQMRAIRSKDRGLLFKSLATDASVMSPVMLDYLLIFRKPGDNKTPIRAGRSEKYGNSEGWIEDWEWIEIAHGVWYRQVRKGPNGLEECPTCDAEIDGEIDKELSQREGGSTKGSQLASAGHPSFVHEVPGIRETNVLNVAASRDEKDERHLCPLQLCVISRCVKLWSNPGDIVLDPFGGVGSTVHQAVKLHRKGVGIELKESYFKTAVRNCRDAESSMKAKAGQQSFLDVFEGEEA